MSLLHNKVSQYADGPNAAAIQPSDWNSEHVVSLKDADIAASAAIAESKLALTFPSHLAFTQANHDALVNPHHAAFTQPNHDALANPHHSSANDHASTNDPTAGQKAALPGTSGVPGDLNRYVTDADTRNTNARAPSGIASGELGGSYPGPTVNATHSGSAHHTRLHDPIQTLDHSFPGGTVNFLRADGSWNAPPAVNIKQAEVNFGATPVADATFTVTDADVLATSQLIAQAAWEAPTGKDLDELEMDDLIIRCQPATGSFTMFIKAADGSYLADTFKINYLIG